MKLDVLCFAAHPDDAELCCGGTLIKIAKSGKKTGIIDLTQGELSTRGTLQIREKETKSASRIIGISIRENLKISDGNIENNADNRLKIISAIRYYKPRIVFIPYHDDRHPDHTNANKLIKEAVFYSGLEKIESERNGAVQKAFRPQKNIYYMQTYTFTPSFIIDISDEYSAKVKAIKCYGTQFYKPGSKGPETFINSKKFSDYTEARALFFGFQAGVKYGEPFYFEQPLKMTLQNLFEL